MSSSYQTWLFLASTILYVFFYIGALVYLGGKRHRHPRAATLAMGGIGIMFLMQIVGILTPVFLSRAFDQSTFLTANALTQLVYSVVRLTAFGMILAAVFVGRRPEESEPGTFSGDRMPTTSDNPYVPPNA